VPTLRKCSSSRWLQIEKNSINKENPVSLARANNQVKEKKEYLLKGEYNVK
jgi:hypothetical protein